MLQCTDIKKQPTANIIDGNVQLHILSLIPEIERLEPNGGEKEWAGPVFPHPTIEKEHAVS